LKDFDNADFIYDAVIPSSLLQFVSTSFDRLSTKGALLQLEKAKFETKIALFSNREVLEDEVSDICQVINTESSLCSQSPTIVLRIFHTMK
jgi:hypothetical protein